MIELLKIIILSIVQGITEWLPISSTGHMRLINEFMPLKLDAQFVSMFFVVVQLGSILAVCLIYFSKLNPFSPSKSKKEQHDTWTLWSKVLIASLPAAILGLLIDDIMDLYFNNPIVIALMLILYGIGFIWIESGKRTQSTPRIASLDTLSYKDAALIGCFQMLALIPGTSRSGSTILGALLLGTSRFVATEFSFFMSIPIMFGASFIKLIKFGLHFTAAELVYLSVGMLVAFGVSLLVINFLLDYIKRHDFKFFGYYRIILGIVVLIVSFTLGGGF